MRSLRELSEEGQSRAARPPQLHGMFFNGTVSLPRNHRGVFRGAEFSPDRGAGCDTNISITGFFSLDEFPNRHDGGLRRAVIEM